MPKTPAQILDQAIHEIEDHGWCRTLKNEVGKVCVRGALYLAAYGNVQTGRGRLGCSEPQSPELTAALRALHAHLFGPTWGLADFPIERDLTDWNDKPERTPDDVVHALKLAREACDAGVHQSLNPV